MHGRLLYRGVIIDKDNIRAMITPQEYHQIFMSIRDNRLYGTLISEHSKILIRIAVSWTWEVYRRNKNG